MGIPIRIPAGCLKRLMSNEIDKISRLGRWRKQGLIMVSIQSEILEPVNPRASNPRTSRVSFQYCAPYRLNYSRRMVQWIPRHSIIANQFARCQISME